MGGQHCPLSTWQSSFDNRLEVFKVARKNAQKFWQPARDPKRNQYRLEFLICTMRYESHLVTISAKRFQKSPAKCPAFSCLFLPSMLCVPAPCGVLCEGKVVCNFLELGQFGSLNSKGVSKGSAWGLFGGNIV